MIRASLFRRVHFVTYPQVKALVEAKTGATNSSESSTTTSSTTNSPIHRTYLIDVRTPEETHRYGMIPTAINIPVNVVQEVLGNDISPEEFEETYGIPKPRQADHSKLVVVLQSGPRLRRARASNLLSSSVLCSDIRKSNFRG
ncbi:rhodanese-like protein, putative [Bodo saltans]|uniref:Rhodanese-like protein, putative n=1 Tax=Bodo saltans TaxID=75058 RepID=A0A0S4IRJ0_BODSA|nr:rhodanese-like protein, putative [Bodo saltans]|eukprot:CUE69413.1 rhodanese-like protein, putative [Bodo saltans]